MSSTSKPIVGTSAPLDAVRTLVEQVAGTDSTVLLLGETGTGKELFASLVHDLSLRRTRPMVVVNCAAIPATLIESELFGRERGAFTDAIARQAGRFELADRSTIFLDEIGDLPPEVQVKLLRTLEDRQIERLGSPKSIPVNVRVIAATHQDLQQRIAQGAFREDLYYRLNVFPIHLPPLRDRVEDIPLLAEHFLQQFASQMGKQVRTVSAEALQLLQNHSWRGNVRELQNAMERAVALEQTESILAESLPEDVRRGRSAIAGAAAGGELPDLAEGFDLEARGEEFYRHYIALALERAGGVQVKAAELLGMSFRSFRYYVKKYNLR